MKLNIDKEKWKKLLEKEGDHEVGCAPGLDANGMMVDPTQPQLERLARAVWPDSASYAYHAALLARASTLSIFTVLVWLAKEYSDPYWHLSFDDGDKLPTPIATLLIAKDPKAAILRAAIEWREGVEI